MSQTVFEVFIEVSGVADNRLVLSEIRCITVREDIPTSEKKSPKPYGYKPNIVMLVVCEGD
jgi:hypothetical protein